MQKTYEELMQDLADTQAKLEQERKQMHAQLQKEKEEMLHLAQAERLLQLEAYQKKVEEHERKRKAEEDAAEARSIHEVGARAKAEQSAAKADEAFQLYQGKLKILQHAITEAEFSEEKNRKDLETAKNMKILPDFVSDNGICVENPVSPSNKGEAVEGTGGLQESALMSLHLKQILRQATRQD
jgi:membrane protein involved in colicin uptake